LERQGFFQVQTDCSSCEGTGTRRTPCGTCTGTGLVRDRRSVQVTVPEGVDTGLTLRLVNQGDAGKYGGPRGHMFVKIQV
jgi:molecular chaperone DnaJ